jgi:hypothetical protein
MYKSLTIDGSGNELEVNWKADRLEWRYVLDSFKSEFSDYAEFDGDAKSWRLPRSQHRALRIWASRHFEHSQIRDRTVHEQPRPQPPQRSALEQAYRVLWLVPGAPGWAVTAMARAATKAHHPDAGGSHEGMVAVNRALEILRREGLAS